LPPQNLAYTVLAMFPVQVLKFPVKQLFSLPSLLNNSALAHPPMALLPHNRIFIMPQQAWSITGHYGNIYKLGIFHGEDTHHVVVHCNNSVVAIDFSVKESKTYSLFLDQQLCEVSIDHTGGNNFTYDCRINYEVETPLNLQRKAQRATEQRSERVRLIAAAVVVLVVLAFLLG
jgi:hypothetical protein